MNDQNQIPLDFRNQMFRELEGFKIESESSNNEVTISHNCAGGSSNGKKTERLKLKLIGTDPVPIGCSCCNKIISIYRDAEGKINLTYPLQNRNIIQPSPEGEIIHHSYGLES